MKKDKREKLLLSMNLIDEAYIEEANIQKTKKPFPWRTFAAIAACVALAVAGVGIGLGLHTPTSPYPSHLAAYADSEYFPIIQRLDAYYEQVSAKNSDGGSEDRFLEKVPSGTASTLVPNGDRYEETTDNQVNCVIEADLIKRSDKNIYYLNGKTLTIYSIEGENSNKVGSFTLADWDIITSQVEMYLSEDCKTVTLIVPCVTRDANSYHAKYYTQIVSLDVSDPSNIVEKGSVTLNCSLNTSRKVDGTILIFGTYYLWMNERPNYSDPSTFVPQITTDSGTVSVPMDSIVVPEELKNSHYTVVCKLSEGDLNLLGSGAFLSYTSAVYVTQENVYAANNHWDKETATYVTTNTQMTEIACLSYRGDSLKPMGTIRVAGRVKDQYSMDEHNGILRVVTTTDMTQAGNDEEGRRFQFSKTSASLYQIDLSTWKVLSKVENFAPDGESVQSVRFDANAAYVCTAEVVTFTDPVFFFDLSDPKKITYTDTGTIQGYSTSLISFGDGYLIGIGVGETRGIVKLEVYRESENGVVSVCSYEVEDAWYLTDYKSYLIDRKNKLIGMVMVEYSVYDPSVPYIENYVLFQYEEGKLWIVNKIPLPSENYTLERTRSVYIDGYLYVLAGEQFEVVPVDLTGTAQ